MRAKFSREQMVAAARRLAGRYPGRDVRLADVASEVRASVSTVSRYVGDARGLKQILEEAGLTAAPRDEPARSAAEPSHEQITQAAYYRWLDRGCLPGDPLTDWLAAEHSLRAAA